MKTFGLAAFCLGIVLLPAVRAQTFEIRQNETLYNWQSEEGAPVSPGPPGPATPNQFRSLISFGAASPGRTGLLPTGSGGGTTLVLSSARVGAPFVSRQLDFLFGSVIPLPETDEEGALLPSNVPKEDYWDAKPHATAYLGYYFSSHANRVYATQSGPIEVIWKPATATITNTAPSGDLLDTNKYFQDGDKFYALLVKRYVVSSSAVKEPRQIYWTERSFGHTGKPVLVPRALVQRVNVVTNSTFPLEVAVEFERTGRSSNDEIRTLWFDDILNGIRAYNAEGRVFVEFLGAQVSGENRRQFGFEIVDVIRQSTPSEVRVDLGEKITPYQDLDDAELFPEPIESGTGPEFLFRQPPPVGSERPNIYAIRETRNLNDALVVWQKKGMFDLKWPHLLARYDLNWPSAVSKYSHYLRPPAATEQEALATAVVMPAADIPQIDYQDPFDRPRAKLTPDFKFYSLLNSTFPAHRALLRFTSGENVRFERVFSWLDTNLKNNTFAGTVAAELTPPWSPNNNDLTAPRVINQTVFVGQRIQAPALESGHGASDPYLAGYINQQVGKAFSVTAYIDPFAKGFEEANKGAIIPVNAVPPDAVPGKNKLEVLWFRANDADASAGFSTVLWPSTLGRYTLQWPTAADEIILASNDGSGALPSLQAGGRIYFQNDSASTGYNPNEEHALMLGGQAYALRDDLNDTLGTDYSSEPFVLLEYTESDGRPAIHAFRVLREKPEAGLTFAYRVTAGQILQPPMPLPLLEKPFAPQDGANPLRNLNSEVSDWTVDSSTVGSGSGLPVSTLKLNIETKAIFPDYRLFALHQTVQSGTTLRWIFVTGVNSPENTVTGVVSASLPFDISPWTISAQPDADSKKWKYAIKGDPVSLVNPVLVAAPSLRMNWTGTVVETGQESGVKFVVVKFTPDSQPRPAAAETASVLVNPVNPVTSGQFNTWHLTSEPPPAITSEAYSKFTFQDRKGDLWVYRGPHDESGQPALFAQFYYKTLPGFYFPNINPQPLAGTITPYLTSRTFVGEKVNGNADHNQIGDGNPLVITYEPAWPEGVPILQMAETLTVPKRGLPAVRGQSSLSLLYEQSIAKGGGSKPSAVLHDPTREKAFELGLIKDSATVLGKIPASVLTSSSRGKTFFPNLPPHLVDRFYFDPNRGTSGALVFKGLFVDAPVGEVYLFPNVLGTKDVATLKALCTTADSLQGAWNSAINNLTTQMEEFKKSTSKPGTFEVQSTSSPIGPSQRAQVANENIAVDSYALSAVGPGTGYVTLVAGDGKVFTPAEEPVSVHILRVVGDLYRGEVKVVQSSNPLNEKLTLQQVADLADIAGNPNPYEFDWRIAAPVDGSPPQVYQNTPRLLLGFGVWSHVAFPVLSDVAGSVHTTPASRLASDVSSTVVAVSRLDLPADTANTDRTFEFSLPAGHLLTQGNQVLLRNAGGTTLTGTVAAATTTTRLAVKIDGDTTVDQTFSAIALHERILSGRPQSIVFRTFTVPAGVEYSDLWLSLDLDPALGARVYLDGQPVVTANRGADDSAPSTATPGDLSPLAKAYRLESGLLAGGTPDGLGNLIHRIAVELFSSALPNVAQTFNLRLEAHEALDLAAPAGSPWIPLAASQFEDGARAIIGEGADVRALSDNYLIMRYRTTNETHASFSLGWSRWAEPQLAEGWIKRVLAGINPFNQRVTDLFNNRVNTDASILTSAGRRWEGDVALDLETINGYGLIEIYETILRRGRSLSIDSGINYGPANDALLLAAGYLNDLYLLVGHEAWADAANPTIAVGKTLSDVATALFAFKGQMGSLLEEELALLRGRDDFIQPGVETAPAYNRLYWNFTRGIDAGEVVYSLNYNIQPDPTKPPTGAITAADAQHMFPQGHGDAYGHYLTAAKGYYSLLMSPDFSWVPRSEAVTILGKPVQVDYQDERKFAAASTAIARAGKQILDLSWRSDYLPGRGQGWEHLSQTRVNNTRKLTTTRYWGTDHWATRVGQGAYLNWFVGNSLLPAVDPDPNHEGIQKIDRTTVTELRELPALAGDVQTALDNAEAGLSPLGLPQDGIAFDINPSRLSGSAPVTHFEQVFERAYQTLVNAASSFNDAKDVTKAIRTEQDTLTEFQTTVDKQELAFQNQLIELYGTPYPDDIGPGRTYVSGYAGPDLVHYMYVENLDLVNPVLQNPLLPEKNQDFKIDIHNLPGGNSWWNGLSTTFNFTENTPLSFRLGPRGFVDKPSNWSGRRVSPGTLQQTIADLLTAHDALRQSLIDMEDQTRNLNKQIQIFTDKVSTRNWIFFGLKQPAFLLQTGWDLVKTGLEIKAKEFGFASSVVQGKAIDMAESIPKVTIAGVSFGTDGIGNATAGGLKATAKTYTTSFEYAILNFESASKVRTWEVEKSIKFLESFLIPQLEWERDLKVDTAKLGDLLYAEHNKLANVNLKLRAREGAQRKYRADIAKGDRIQAERETFRLRAAALIQGYRTRDAAFRIFRNEKLERYKSLFDLAARYSLLAANAYDYETGLLHTSEGKAFVRRIVSSRALGVVKEGAPQFAGSDTGDPGLSSALAEMKADFDVLKGRLGFNNPDSYGTTVSLRTENSRITYRADDDQKWRDVLERGRMANLLDDEDVRRHCLQIDPGGGLPVPGIVLTFSTTIANFYNLFGRQLAGGDHSFSPSSFATKIYALGVALEGYQGMNDPDALTAAISTTVGTSPSDPSAPFLGTDALAATPYIYLVPVGADSMRSPPLGDESEIRTWNVSDVAIPLPFNIGASDFSTKPLWQSSESLTEPLFSVRKHQAFRPVSASSRFAAGSTFQRTQFMNARLVGRSVWNSQWKLVIPGHTLLNNPDEGLDRLIRTVKDVRLHFQTYSYSGN